MSRETYNVEHRYTGDGTVSEYDFDFKIEELSQLLVIEYNAAGVETQRVRGTDTTYLSGVTFDSTGGGGSVTLAANLTSGYTLILLLANDAPTQPYQFRNKGAFTLKLFEMALDFILGPVQRLQYLSNRALRLNELDDPDSIIPILPSVTDKEELVLAIKADGTGLEWVPRIDQDALDNALTESGTPPGGLTGDYLVKASDDDLDVDWESGTYSGFSARFSEAFDTTSVRATLNQILDLTYLGPQVSLSATGSGTVREKGTAVTASTLTANVTKRTDPIARIHFKLDGATIYDEDPALNDGSGATNYAWTGSFDDNVTFSVEVTDDGASGGPSTTTANRSFTFVYPYYYGVGAAGLTAAQVAALTKDVRTETNSYNRSFGARSSEVYYFAYPTSYGTLSSILDENAFETIGDWTLTTSNITGLDGNAVSYNIYEFNNVATAPATNYVFIQ